MISRLAQVTRGGICAALCFILLPLSTVLAESHVDIEPFISRALHDQLSSEIAWHALLHSDGVSSQISDTNFLLSTDHFTPEAELRDTLHFLYGSNPENVCRFPARYYWLKSRLDLPDLPLDSCAEVVEFRSKAPLHEISLGFASENLTHPESMMGHAFLKLTGHNSDNNEISYVVSFYTDVQTWNIPKLFAESMITGKQSYFALVSYPEKLNEYVEGEQRKLWIYHLAFTPQQRELIRLHLLELKNAHMTYFFHNYNCATVIDYILELSGKKNRHNILWSTPKGVVKNAHEMGLVTGTEVVPPSR